VSASTGVYTLSLHDALPILLLGNVAHNELPALMQYASLVVLPSYHEGVPNVLLESMAAGTPVVATAVGGIPKIVEQGVSGILVPDRKSTRLNSSHVKISYAV